MSDPALALLGSAAWLAIHVAAGYAVHRLGAARLRRENWWSRERDWEGGGRLYERLGIRTWKRWLPEAGAVFPGGFDKSRLARRDAPYLRTYLRETRRAELGHLLVLGAGPFFTLWNPPWLAACMMAYAVLANVPCIASQRFNRLRLRRALDRRRRAGAPARRAPGRASPPVPSPRAPHAAPWRAEDR